MRYQPIYDIAEICVRQNIRKVVLCPGSRCAPLTLAFTRHPQIVTRTFSDERSAGFIALGMAQASKTPVIIVCTSGTAVYNLAPAVAEAFFSQTPLIVLTADRPAEWIAQHDGQTIYQSEIFGKHVKRFFQLPQDYDHPDSQWAINRIMNEALNLSHQTPTGPVHINAPFREPLYPTKQDGEIRYSSDVRVIHEDRTSMGVLPTAQEKIRSSWSGFNNILLVAGQRASDAETTEAVSAFQRKHHVPVVHDIISNLHEVGNTVQHADLFLGQAPDNLKEMLRPDLLITFGQSLISKNLKIFLRKYPARKHWHIQPGGVVADTFRNLTDIFTADPNSFLQFLASLEPQPASEIRKQKDYYDVWREEERRVLRALDEYMDGQGGELAMVKHLIESLPENSDLHLANSMSVRYANMIGIAADRKGIHVYSNRGTSGIDGSTSTAVGHALSSDRPQFLITGDLAFFYDRNAFWHNYSHPNLRILLLNNHGGLIFDILDGPSSMPEAREYFITRQKLNARKLCEEFGFAHLRPEHPREIKDALRDFLTFDDRTSVMELESDTTNNKQIFDQLKLKIRKSYEL